MSCAVVVWLVLSCPGPVLSCPVLSCPVLPVLSFLSSPVLSFAVLVLGSNSLNRTIEVFVSFHYYFMMKIPED